MTESSHVHCLSRNAKGHVMPAATAGSNGAKAGSVMI
jgi:hypothetical protein